MAQFIEKAKSIEALQFKVIGDHKDIVAHPLKEKLNGVTCTKCGQAIIDHGARFIDAIRYDTICPGTWILDSDNGTTRYLDEASLNKGYEVAKANG